MKTVVNEKVVIRNLTNRQAALYAASELRKYFNKNFRSLDFHFTVRDDKKGCLIEVISLSEQVYNEQTIAICLGYAIRVMEEFEKLFGDIK